MINVLALEKTTTSYSLSQLLGEVKAELDKKFKGEYLWIRGELSDWSMNSSSGHYYGELIEYASEHSKQACAKARLNMWSTTGKKVIPKFSEAAGEAPKVGMKVLLCVQVAYHINFGLSLNVIDIDPNFTLGDREARKKQILDELQKEGIIYNNKKLAMPTDYTSVAVISSTTAAGKGDFFSEADLLEDNNLCTFTMYPALMQGAECASSVVKSFRRVYSDIKSGNQNFDAVVLIRGGGSQSDLDSFNHNVIARAICHMPVPVFIGLGHQRDKTVLDSIAHRCFDTPSKVISEIQSVIINNSERAKYNFSKIDSMAKALLKHHSIYGNNAFKQIHDLSGGIINASHVKGEALIENVLIRAKSINRYAAQKVWQTYYLISKNSGTLLDAEENRIFSVYGSISQRVCMRAQNEKSQITALTNGINSMFKARLHEEKSIIDHKYKSVLSMSIEPTLKRGFCVTRCLSGEYITSSKDAKGVMEVVYHDGSRKIEVKHG